MREVLLAGGQVDPALRPSLAAKDAPERREALVLVQFVGPVKEPWLARLRATGAAVLGYAAQNGPAASAFRRASAPAAPTTVGQPRARRPRRARPCRPGAARWRRELWGLTPRARSRGRGRLPPRARGTERAPLAPRQAARLRISHNDLVDSPQASLPYHGFRDAAPAVAKYLELHIRDALDHQSRSRQIALCELALDPVPQDRARVAAVSRDGFLYRQRNHRQSAATLIQRPHKLPQPGVGALAGAVDDERVSHPVSVAKPLLDSERRPHWAARGGRSSAGRAPGCGPGGRGFESRRSPSRNCC